MESTPSPSTTPPEGAAVATNRAVDDPPIVPIEDTAVDDVTPPLPLAPPTDPPPPPLAPPDDPLATHDDIITPEADIRQDIPTRKRKKMEFTQLRDGVRVGKSFSNRNFVDYIIPNPNDIIIFPDYLESVSPSVEQILKDELKTKTQIKSNLVFVIVFASPNTATVEYCYKTANSILVHPEDVADHVKSHNAKLISQIELRELAGSGFTISRIKHLEVRISKFKMLRGRGFIKLPKWISDKKAVINIQADTEDCFKLCILAQFSRSNQCVHVPRMIRENEHRYNFDIPFPPRVKDVRKFCTLNNLSINIFGVLKKEIYPIWISKVKKIEHFNLLYLEDGRTAHYCLIKNLSRLVSSQVNKNRSHKYFCRRCLLHFVSLDRLHVHVKDCADEKCAKIVLPKEQEFFAFKDYDAAQYCPLIMTLDLESILQDVSTCTPSTDHSFTNVTQIHVAVSFGAYLYSSLPVDQLPDDIPLGYHGELCETEEQLEQKFLMYLDKVTMSAAELFSRYYPINMSDEDERLFQQAERCYVCYKPFTQPNDKVRDHFHSLPYLNYRGAAHGTPCNIQMRRVNHISCYVHGLGNYDSHHLLQFLAKNNISIRILPCTLEKYLSFSVWFNGVEIRFLDSIRLLNASLADITANLPEEKYVETKKTFPTAVHNLLMKKGPFPYSFLFSVSQLARTTYPDRIWFKNDLTNLDITDEEYERGRAIWRGCECKTFADFLKIYQASDTTQLLDCILYARSIFWDKFGLDVAWFYSLPHLSMSCMLKHTGVEIELITEHMSEAYELIKRSIYGGFTMCPTRYLMAENDINIMFTDCVSLYPFCMMEYLMPISDYKMVAPNLHDWVTVDIYGEMGYFLEVDLFFPQECHDYLNCLPPVCERKKPPGCTTARLINDLTPKLNYVISLAQFQIVLKVGGVCTKIHQVLQFKQSNYMRSYIEIVSQWRRDARSTYESNFYKLSLNSLYGKFNEVLERRRTVEIVTNPQRLEKLVRKGTFIDRHILNFKSFQMVLVELAKGVIKQNRPNIVGSQILAFSKYYMLSFWYNVLKPTFADKNLKLILTDTDSFIFAVDTPTFYDDLLSIRQHFDFSNLPVDNPLFSPLNAKKFGSFKDESCGNKILGVCTPRSKTYSIKYETHDVNKLKGIQKSFVKNSLNFDNYKTCVLDKTKTYARFNNIISKDHKLYTVDVNKLALEATDMKRVILQDGVNTLAYGHYNLP